MKKASNEMNLIIFQKNKEEMALEVNASKIDKKKFKIFKPFFEGLRRGSRMALMMNFFSMFRRLANLYAAMFLQDSPYL